MRVTEAARIALDAAVIEGDKLLLQGQLDRKVYTETNKVIELLGGKWNRSAKAHLLPEGFADALDAVMITGEVVDIKKLHQQFFTPKRLAVTAVLHADVQKGHLCLEPSAGGGALVDEMMVQGAEVVAFEIDPTLRAALNHRWADTLRFSLPGDDFMQHKPRPLFDRVVMNPPFTRQQDVDHVQLALQCLRPGGILVAIMSPSWRYRTNAKSVLFRELVATMDPEHLVTDNEAGAFKESGTNVATVLLKVRAPL
jgi:predicted RNA methylase